MLVCSCLFFDILLRLKGKKQNRDAKHTFQGMKTIRELILYPRASKGELKRRQKSRKGSWLPGNSLSTLWSLFHSPSLSIPWDQRVDLNEGKGSKEVDEESENFERR